MNVTTVGEVMTKSPHTINVDAPLDQAKKQMYSLGVRHLPVLRGGECIGILSDRDVKLAFAVDKESSDRLRVEDAFQSDVYTAEESTALHEVTATMAREGIGSAVVTDSAGTITGIFTTTDACRVLTSLLQPRAKA